MIKHLKKDFPSILNCKISVLGLGYVGLPLALELAMTSFCKRTGSHLKRKIVGFDIDQNRIDQLKNGIDSTQEISSDEATSLSKITFTKELDDIYDSDVFIVTVPTPIDSQKIPDLKPLLSVLLEVVEPEAE